MQYFLHILIRIGYDPKKQMNKIFLKSELEFYISNNKEYEVEVIRDNAVYVKKAKMHLLDLYQLVSYQNY